MKVIISVAYETERDKNDVIREIENIITKNVIGVRWISSHSRKVFFRGEKYEKRKR